MDEETDNHQKILYDIFGSNYWYVADLYEKYRTDPSQLSGFWQKYFSELNIEKKNRQTDEVLPNTRTDDHKAVSAEKIQTESAPETVQASLAGSPDIPPNYQLIAGAPAKIIHNMNVSLSIPTATSQRTISVKLLEENRKIINQHRHKNNQSKISFTHIIAYAIVKALKNYSGLNNSYAEIKGKPYLVKKDIINFGIAVDVEKKDKSRSLIVPNIKNVRGMNFADFSDAYDDIIERSRTGRIEPGDFQETTLTLTNPGTVGTVSSIPRLMQGQGLIIAIGVIEYPAQYQATSKEVIAALGVGKVMNITSTYDHRIIQGAESGLLLKEVNELLLGKNDFYEGIFSALKIFQRPVCWEEDIAARPAGKGGILPSESIEKQARILQLINYYRVRGHLIANLNPLNFKPGRHPELDPAEYGLTIWDYDRRFITGGLAGTENETLRKILEILQKTYCEKLGIEYMHIQHPEEKTWLQQRMEPNMNTPSLPISEKKRILWKLATAEAFERFLHTKFVGHKRFSLEGSETVIPVLDHLVGLAAEANVEEIVFGMAHRGRLNVLANIIGKPYEKIFSEFEGNIDPDSVQGSGDVKYHLGASGVVPAKTGRNITVSVASNPSHLEWVNPVVEGIVRAKQQRLGDVRRNRVIPLLIHGDAAFAGQGVVAETLNLSQLKGYRTGGTIHLIINNQIGFTTNPDEARSSLYASDVAKMVQAPIIHVNGDDPEASLWASTLAFEYRQKFNKDIVIDLFGFRKYGHNEGDDPAYTQPLMYKKIKAHPGVKEIYKGKLLKEGVISENEFIDMEKNILECLDLGFKDSQSGSSHFNPSIPLAVSEEELASNSPSEETASTAQNIQEAVKALTSVPGGFQVNTKLLKNLEKRKQLLTEEDYLIDWAYAEALAFGTLLLEGKSIRLSGQDSARGTFSQRHLILTDTNTGEEYIPLNNLKINFPKAALIEPYDSLLSEAAVLGFEFGYSAADPLTLVLWEAQFGDFVNSAQVIIDNFMVSSNHKWELPNNVVLLLPHGFEGQGPEHSSARIERFLTLCAQDNMTVCYSTTPAQYFHLLRRQAKSRPGKPLVIFTPKSLLRLPEARSQSGELTSGSFQNLIAETTEKLDDIRRIILVSGKLYYELEKYRNSSNIHDTIIIRIEQLYPFPYPELKNELYKYKNIERIIWAQEEPQNMGPWSYMLRRLLEITDTEMLKYAGRSESASPASGSLTKHNMEQQKLIEDAFNE